MRPTLALAPRRTQLLIVLIMTAAPYAHAAPIYRCESDGRSTFQDRPCERGAQAEVTLRTTAFGESTAAAEPKPSKPQRSARARTAPRARTSESPRVSYECTATNGERFYRHDRCPPRVRDALDGREVAVRTRRVERTRACTEIAAARALTRPGHRRDQDSNPYDRARGTDPCA